MIGRGARRDDGASLVEVLVASVLTLGILMMGYGILASSTASARAISGRSVSLAGAREAIDTLEANLRYSTGVWVCSTMAVPFSPTACTAPAAPPAGGSRAATAMLFVTNAAGGPQPGCVAWTISSAGLQQYRSNGAILSYTLPGVMAWLSPSAVQTAGFATPIGGLVVIDLLVNDSVKASDAPQLFATSDAVSVHDLVAPGDLPVLPAVLAPTPPASC